MARRWNIQREREHLNFFIALNFKLHRLNINEDNNCEEKKVENNNLPLKYTQ